MLKINFDKKDILGALEPAMGCVSTKNTKTVVGGIRLTVSEKGCEIAAYDFEKGFRSYFPANIETEGSAVIPA